MGRGAARYRKIPKGAIRIDLPNTTQVEDYTCGPSALLAICAYYGVGPEWEWEVEEDMKATEDGTDPVQIVEAAERYGLRTKEFRGMTDEQLLRCLKKRRPVVMMLQAWKEDPPEGYSYADEWGEGHWVVAIGFDKKGIYVEDPSLHNARGFLTFEELAERWHDIEGADQHHVERYGVAIWRKGAGGSAYDAKARRVD
jgi:predicted double-glycine peptidase